MILFLIFGEDDSDRRALAHLIKAIAEGKPYKTKLLRRPVVLAKNAAASGKRQRVASEIAGFYRGFLNEAPTICVIVHRDCDDIEPAHVEEASNLETEIKAQGVPKVIAATPAWEMETWWMLFPDAVAQTRNCWRPINYGTQNVGYIRNSKERLTRDLKPLARHLRSSCPNYREEDGVNIAYKIAENPDLLKNRQATSDSFRDFFTKVDGLFNPRAENAVSA